jgi:hypothetical protein
MNWTLCSSSCGQHKILPSSITSLDRSSSRARQSQGRNGIRVGNHRKQRQVLRFLDGFQRVHVSMQRAQGLRFPPWRLPRVPPPLQRGLSLYHLFVQSIYFQSDVNYNNLRPANFWGFKSSSTSCCLGIFRALIIYFDFFFGILYFTWLLSDMFFSLYWILCSFYNSKTIVSLSQRKQSDWEYIWYALFI